MKTTIVASCLFLVAPLLSWADTASDQQIEAAAKATYNFRTAVDPTVNVKVSEGVVTLTGKVSSDEQRRIAEDTVSEIPGVLRVDNRIKVTSGSREGSDDWIAMKVRSRLLVKANVSLVNTKVMVNDGVVTLTGRAPTAAQKELTEQYVKEIDGVRSVRNELVVGEMHSDEPKNVGRDMPTGRDTLGENMDDSSITAQIKYELFSHKSTSALRTKVVTNHGHVMIGGDASSDAEKELVTAIAKSVRGVDAVDNIMTVK